MNESRRWSIEEQLLADLIHKNLRAQELCWEFNMLNPLKMQLRDEKLRQLIKHVGENVNILSPFYCGYGDNIRIGDETVINVGATFFDEAEITIGDRVAIGPHCSIFTSSHPIDFNKRAELITAPITIENDVWIGANVTILRGVTIGSGSVIAAGAVIDYDVPPLTIAYGRAPKTDRKIILEKE